MRRENHLAESQPRKGRLSFWDLLPPPYITSVVAYCFFLFYLSSVSSFPVPPPFRFFDKIVHFCLFGGLSGLLAFGLQRARYPYSFKMLFIVPVGFSVLYGLSDEIHQLFVAYRTFSIADLAADAAGAAAAAVFLLLVHQWRQTKKRMLIKGGRK